MMKAFKLNTESWHYKFATNFGYDIDHKDHDICAYLRRVLLGFAISALVLIVAIGLTWAVSELLVNMILGPIFYLLYGLKFNELCILGWGIVLVAGGAFGFVIGLDKL